MNSFTSLKRLPVTTEVDTLESLNTRRFETTPRKFLYVLPISDYYT